LIETSNDEDKEDTQPAVLPHGNAMGPAKDAGVVRG